MARISRKRASRSRPLGFELLESRSVMATVPAGFVVESFASGLDQPTSFALASDGRMFVTEKDGDVRVVFANGAISPTTALSLDVNSIGERGLQSITLDPQFATNGKAYVYGTRRLLDKTVNRLSQFTLFSGSTTEFDPASEVILVDDVRHSTSGLHNGGFLQFGADGMLYLGIGDTADSARARDLTKLEGKVLRINPAAYPNVAPIDNPFVNVDNARPEIWAVGFRNPYSGAFDPVTGDLFVNDVGGELYEEVNRLVRGGDFGWPAAEGPSTDESFVNPVYAYAHNNVDAAATGGVFYRGASFPSTYVGRYFVGDFARGIVQVVDPVGESAESFATGMNSPVDLDTDAQGNLYSLSFLGGTIQRIRYAPSNLPPIVRVTTSATSGLGPLTVTFNASASSDPENAPLSFAWDFGDGATGTGALATRTYTTNGVYIARLTVSDGSQTTVSDPIRIVVGSRAPTPTILTPATGLTYAAGDTITFSGSATDPDEGPLPASSLTWDVWLLHDNHRHPALRNLTGVAGGSFVIETEGEVDPDQGYRIELTATDATGIKTMTFVDVTPRTATFTLASNVPGAKLLLDGSPRTAGTTITGVVGMRRTIEAPSQQLIGGVLHRFLGWSDGVVDTAREWTTPAAGGTLTALYQAVPWAGAIVGRPPTFFQPEVWREYRLTVTNTGNQSWQATGPNAVRLAAYTNGTGDDPGEWTSPPSLFNLPRALAPGESAEVVVSLPGPVGATSATLRHRLVRGTNDWFGEVAKTQIAVGTLRASYAVDMATVPAQWPAGEIRNVTVVVTNTGTAAWNNSGLEPVALGAAFVAPGTAAGSRPTEPLRAKLPNGVLPGQSVSVTLSIDAPTELGPRSLRFGMVKELVNWFPDEQDVATSVVANRVAYDVSNVPTTWIGGDRRTYQVTLTNLGDTVWRRTGANPINLAWYFQGRSDAPNDWIVEPTRVPSTRDVAPGESITLDVTAIAPTTPGTYVLRHRLVAEGLQWFPQLAKTNVTVNVRAASYDMTNVPGVWLADEQKTFVVPVTNTGTTTWSPTGANPVRFAWYFSGRSDTIYDWATEPIRVDLAQAVAPSETALVTVVARAPSTGGPASLRVRMLAEGAAWFTQLGKAAVDVQSLTASYNVSSVPAVWLAGQTRPITVVVTNTGSVAWSPIATFPIRLAWYFSGRSDALFDWTSEPIRVDLPRVVAPGESISLTFQATAPTTAGVGTLRVRMIAEGLRWFDGLGKVAVDIRRYAASYVATAVPTQWSTGESKTYNVTVTNTGSTTWFASGATPTRLAWYFEGRSDAANDWTVEPTRVALTRDVAPGQSIVVSVTAQAPTTPGTYVLRHRMVTEGLTWFAELAKTTVTVTTPMAPASARLSATYTPQTRPAATTTTGQIVEYRVRVTNTSTTAWEATGRSRVRMAIYLAPTTGTVNLALLNPVAWVTLPTRLAARGTVDLVVRVTLPTTEGAWRIHHRLLRDDLGWFAQSLAVDTTVRRPR